MSSSAPPSPSRLIVAAAATSSAAAKTLSVGNNLKVVGIILAIASGLLIGSSFVFKKRGLLRSQAGGVAGEGVAYLKSALWWTGMIMMILGELCNFAAYAFVEAIVVTPLGALSVVVCAILSSIFLKETLTFFGWLGCGLCIIGSVIIALNGPREDSVGQIKEFQKLFLAPGFLVYGSVLIVASLVIIFYFAPRYGRKSMLWYIMVCSMIGGISVSVTTGLGSAIVTTAMGDNQFKYWFLYFLMAFVAITLITEVYYLNVALALFNTAMVTPTYYVIFTFFSMVTTIILFQGLKASAPQILTIVMGFLTICVGITILQMSKVDPVSLTKLDRRSTLLLEAARSKTETLEEKGAIGIEDPGMDALRGSFGTVGSIIRARSVRRMSQSSQLPRTRSSSIPSNSFDRQWHPPELEDHPSGMKRHQLYDAPMPPRDDAHSSVIGSPMSKKFSIKFDSQDVVHQYKRPGTGNEHTTEHRLAVGSPAPSYPPLPHNKIDGLPDTSSSATRVDLLEMDDTSLSPIAEGGSSENSGSTGPKQSIELPMSRFANEHEVHSAPPTVNTRFSGAAKRTGLPPRISSRDVFEKSSHTETLLSFPSVTDSARSQDSWTSEGARTREKEREKRAERKYPKGTGEDDREESISLWQKDDDGDDDGPSSGHVGTVRLVQPRTGEPF